MTGPFATMDDLEDRWRTLLPDERRRAWVLLEDASALIRDLGRDVDARVAAGTLSALTLTGIACAMVKRVMQGPPEMDGITQHQQGAGPFSQGVTFANPTGDLYLTKLERQRIGADDRRAFSIDLTP